ncbi:hypothetical protein TRM7557_01644 [Tritonibacter multivorans]|uniref:TnsA endonuclease N-terminal domain-containing protein n=1 Tax=Tritonibacter multivorans TaxID=928856 RepID=A0A0P1G8R7_9RHOB|nr:hypothetical protein [Tritonibacter multivorans]MDA7422208.1 hypothetical protein [Tritonibacter multivorans]CUH77912.1 hypothetical protein TRM7557_01644 [Tritonibacter multivorans]SFD10087.1 hypothetical protein SAMN04488049_1073 [Tritonibacter multivorans]
MSTHLQQLPLARQVSQRTRPLPSRAKRTIPKSTRRHFVGELVFNRAGHRQRLGFASMYEHNAALCFIYRPDFLDVEEQLASLPFVLPNGKKSEHFFDFRVTFKCGRRVCISVKPERIAQTYQYRAKMDCIRQAAIGNICDEVRTFTERNIDPVELHNAKLFHSSRDPEVELDARVIAALQLVTSPVRISDFLAEIGLEGVGFRSVARAIRLGEAKLFNREKITGRSLIICGETT